MNTIPYGRQDISDADIDAVVKVLRSDYLTQGSVTPTFEKEVSSYCGVQYALAVNSATSALHIACLALGVSKGDVVWTTPITFVATPNSALYCGATIDFVDIDPQTYNMSIECLTKKLEQAELVGELPKVVMPVHMCGQPCDMESIYSLSQKFGFKIIEDASHAIGSRYKNKRIGGCHYSEITIFSFHPVKIITSGEGGMALTNAPDLAAKMQLFRSHGITSDVDIMQPQRQGEIWNYQQIELGFNYRMSDIHAALGLHQMRRLDEFVVKRQYIAKRYDELLANMPIVRPWQHPDSYTSFHLYIIRFKLHEIKKSHREIYSELLAAGIGVNLHYIPVYRQPYYERMGFKVGYCSQAEEYYSEVISIPIYPGMTEKQQGKVVKELYKAIGI